MKTQTKKLLLKRETLRDLMAQNAGDVKGGKKGGNGGGGSNGKHCPTAGCLDTMAECSPLTEYCW